MPARFDLQPNGLLARFSTVVDNFTHIGLTPREAIEVAQEDGLSLEAARKKVRRGMDAGPERLIDDLDTVRAIHGDAERAEIQALLAESREDADLTFPEDCNPRDEALLTLFWNTLVERGLVMSGVPMGLIREVVQKHEADNA